MKPGQRIVETARCCGHLNQRWRLAEDEFKGNYRMVCCRCNKALEYAPAKARPKVRAARGVAYRNAGVSHVVSGIRETAGYKLPPEPEFWGLKQAVARGFAHFCKTRGLDPAAMW